MILAATGHRPDKLGGYDMERERALVYFATKCLETIGPKEVISGMALGWDQAVAEAAARLGLPFVAAIPFYGQDRLWTAPARARYEALLDRSDKVFAVANGEPVPVAMQLRNQWMVDNSTHLLALWNGTPGGTHNCLRYAKGEGRKFTNVYDGWQTYWASGEWAI